MGLVVTAIGAGILAYVVTWFMREIVFYRGPPRDLPFPIVGHLPWLIKYTSRYAFHDFLGDLSHRYGDISAFTLFGSSFVTIERASEAKRILTSNNFGRGDLLQSMFSGLLSFALFLLPSNDGLWKKHRKWIQPAFGPANVRFTLDASNTVMHRVEGFLDQLINDTPDAILKSLDMAHLSSLITLDIIGRVAFSRDLKNVEALQTLKKTETAELTGKIAMIVEERFTYPKLLWPFMGISDQAMQTAVFPVDTFLKQVIQERKIAGSVSKDPSKSDIIDRLLSTSSDGTEVFSDQETAEELLSFFFAGHETTGNMLTCIVRRICEAPKVYEKLLEAVKDLDSNCWDAIHACKYLDWTVKEGLRLDPTAAVLGRINLRPVTVLGYTFTKRTEFTIDVLSLHRDPRYFTDPLTFNPDRWDNNFIPETGSYIPFGDGPTICIGQKIAVLELKVVLCRLLQKYSIELVPGQDLQMVTSITTGLKNGLFVNLKHRD